jgi:hypothetical protein
LYTAREPVIGEKIVSTGPKRMLLKERFKVSGVAAAGVATSSRVATAVIVAMARRTGPHGDWRIIFPRFDTRA